MLEAKIPLLQEILVDAETHPESYDPQHWAAVRVEPELGLCGTTVCIGGSAVLRTGHRIDWFETYPGGGCLRS